MMLCTRVLLCTLEYTAVSSSAEFPCCRSRLSRVLKILAVKLLTRLGAALSCGRIAEYTGPAVVQERLSELCGNITELDS
jgi:hypothetical protein